MTTSPSRSAALADVSDRRSARNAAVWAAYLGSAELTGPAMMPAAREPSVIYRPLLSSRTRAALTAMVVVNTILTAAFLFWLLLPSHLPDPGYVRIENWRVLAARVCFCLVVIVEAIKVCQNVAIWLLVYRAMDPVPLAPPTGLRVALLTTIVASREPIALVERTLHGMIRLTYRGRLDVWVLDEEDSPEVRAMARRLGVRHFTRRGRPEYNQPAGEFRAKTKAGNHNAWRAEHEAAYDVVCQMDPDHVPFPCLLARTLGYFRDPDTAFVVGPQVYGNVYDTFVSRGASVQQYVFSGVIERAGNGFGAPLLIGTNHLYRPAAWRQIGGYQDSITEDHLTGMRILGTVNPATGRPWRGVYTPDVLAIGEGPTTWTDYFNQQRRWAYGIWQIKVTSRLRRGIALAAPQRLLFGMVQFYYPSVALHLVLGSLATTAYLLIGGKSARVDGTQWVALWGLSMASWLVLWLWLRRFNLAPHERRDLGLHGIVLTLVAGPVYVAAAIAATLRRPLTYTVTAKGGLRSTDSARTFRLHWLWAAAAVVVIAASVVLGNSPPALQVWTGLALVTGLGPPIAAAVTRARSQRHRPR
ncbi:glycosyltransferase family 2 protein [Pseudonocardia sp. GCM10023141]|uniref:glycosyltransferase family 2 protein n=1 Tax=Pseudonocardia sp. GCM10023141 TaxID=3252653 RepID=UPI00362459FC